MTKTKKQSNKAVSRSLRAAGSHSLGQEGTRLTRLPKENNQNDLRQHIKYRII